MAITVDDLRTQVGASSTPQENTLLQRCLDLATELVRRHVTVEVYPTLPTVIAESAVLAVATEVFNQRKAPNGVLNQAFSSPDGLGAVAVRIGADPMRPAYPILSAYVGGLTT